MRYWETLASALPQRFDLQEKELAKNVAVSIAPLRY